MKKQYISASFEVIKLTNSNIVTASSFGVYRDYQEGKFTDLAPDRRFESWEEGY